MRYVNNTGIDRVWERAVRNSLSKHPKMDDANVYSVTELLKSPKQICMKRMHDDEIELEIADQANIFVGNCVHECIEKTANEMNGEEETRDVFIAEERLEMDLGDGLVISGGFDRYDKDTNVLHDNKTAKSPTIEEAIKYEANDWSDQTKMYSIMMDRTQGIRPCRREIEAIATDFSKMKKYDVLQYGMVHFGWDEKRPSTQREIEEEQNFIEGFHDKAMLCRDILEGREDLADHECTPEDCWCTEDWAIIKKGKVKAENGGVFKNEHDARLAFIDFKKGKDGDKMRLYHRVSQAKMCAKYCDCRFICEQGKRMCELALKEDITDTEEEIPF